MLETALTRAGRLAAAPAAAALTLAALPAGTAAAVAPGTSHRVTFGGRGTVTIPPGGEALSDPVRMPASAVNLALLRR